LGATYTQTTPSKMSQWPGIPLPNYYLHYYKTNKEYQKVLHIQMYKTCRYV